MAKAAPAPETAPEAPAPLVVIPDLPEPKVAAVIEDAPPPKAEVPLHERPLHELTPEQQIEAFTQKVYAQRAEAQKEPPPPPPLTERQRAQIEAEKEAGRRALEKHAANLAAQRANAVQVSDAEKKAQGTSTPVFTPSDYVPNMNQGRTAGNSSRTQNL
jgi:hypothetical protein